jgi:hypothetical protein
MRTLLILKLALAFAVFSTLGLGVMWHRDHQSLQERFTAKEGELKEQTDLTETFQNSSKEYFNHMVDYKNANDQLTSDNAQLKAQIKETALALVEQIGKTETVVKAAEQLNDNFTKQSASYEAHQNALESQNEALKLQAISPKTVPIYIPINPNPLTPASPPPITGATIHTWYPGMTTLDFY